MILSETKSFSLILCVSVRICVYIQKEKNIPSGQNDTFTHNDDDGYVQFSTNWTQKRLSYQNHRLIFINLQPPVMNSPYSPSYDSSNIAMYEIYSWKTVIYDRKIAAIILYI